MGLETHTFAWQTGGEIGERTSDFFYPISAENKEAILEKCREIGVDAVASIASDIAARSAAFVANALGLPSNRYAAVMLATNKIQTRTLLQAHGISQPAFVSIGDVLPLEALQALRYPLIVKPSDRSAGRGLSVVESPEGLFAAINAAREVSFERQAIVEEYIDGALYSCECLSFGGRHLVLGFTRRHAIRFGDRILEKTHIQPAVLAASAEQAMTEISARILTLLGLTSGASSIEFILKDGVPYIVEVTPTMYGDYIGTHLIPRAYGYDYLGSVLEIAMGGAPRAVQGAQRVRAKVSFAYSREDGAESAPLLPDGKRYGHRITEEPIKAFGGCPAIRIPEGKPYFSGEGVLALNSEYTALSCALRATGAKRLHLPHYAAPAYEKVAAELSVKCEFYHIDERFLPIGLSPEAGDAVLVINYHGLLTEYIRGLTLENLIVDHSTAFFAPPILRQGAYNIYSCRKHFAVADGAYLVAERLPEDLGNALERDVSYPRAAALLRAAELGEAYKEMQSGEQALLSERKRMSRLTEKMLAAVNYEEEKTRRKAIFARLHGALCKYNLFPIDPAEDLAPQFYPLLVDGDIRNRLIEKKIYTPLMWRKTLTEAFEGLAEKRFSERMVCLPISAEDTDEDVDSLAETVIAAIT